MYNVCKYKTSINVHYYLPFLSTVSMSLGMSIIMSVVNSEIKWKTVITAFMKVEMDTITVLMMSIGPSIKTGKTWFGPVIFSVITYVYLELCNFISRTVMIYNVFSDVML